MSLNPFFKAVFQIKKGLLDWRETSSFFLLMIFTLKKNILKECLKEKIKRKKQNGPKPKSKANSIKVSSLYSKIHLSKN